MSMRSSRERTSCHIKSDSCTRKTLRGSIAIDEVDQAVPGAMDARDVELHRGGARRLVPGAEVEQMLVREGSIVYTQRHGGEGGRGALGLVRVHDQVHAALAVEQHLARAVPGHRREAQLLQQGAELLRRTRRTRYRRRPGDWLAAAALPRLSSGASSRATARSNGGRPGGRLCRIIDPVKLPCNVVGPKGAVRGAAGSRAQCGHAQTQGAGGESRPHRACGDR